jgi:lysophospholipase L1-like esterase
MMSPTRREFLAASVAAVAGMPKLSSRDPRSATPGFPPSLDGVRRVRRRTGTVLLFQGDSITDCDRDRSNPAPNDARALGTGYPLVLAGALRDRDPERDLQVFNRGVSGNTVEDLRARWVPDTIELKPAVLSILIGVNDKWHTLTGNYDGTAEKYETGYRSLLEATRTALPDVRVVVMEPFVLRTGAVSDAWFPDFDKYRAAARRVAENAKATFVPLHDVLQDLAAKATPAYWAADGVHPTVAGHAAIARQWLDRVRI